MRKSTSLYRMQTEHMRLRCPSSVQLHIPTWLLHNLNSEFRAGIAYRIHIWTHRALRPHPIHQPTLHHLHTMSYRRVDASDPRRPEQMRPLVLPKSWNPDDLDVYASFLGSVSMMSGAAMLTRAPYIAYAGLVFACAHIAHDKPFKSNRTKEVSTGGPWMSLLFSFLALLALILPKLSKDDLLGFT